MIYLIHIFRNFRKFIKYPIQFMKLLSSGIKKDFFFNKNKKNMGVW